MALELKGKTALITGGCSGIGLSVAKRLVSEGSNVVVVDLDLRQEAQDAITASCIDQTKAKFTHADVTKWDQLQGAFDFAMKEFGRLDIVIPGAGIFEPEWSSFWQFNKGKDLPSSSSFATLDLNVTHPIRATQLAIDYFTRQKLGHGVVVLISSIAAQLGLLPTPLYCASKAAISSFARSMGALEPHTNIRVNAIAPGLVKTPIWTPEKLAWVDEQVDSWVSTEQVADTIVDLITKKEHVGGTVLEVGVDRVRAVDILNDPGPSGKGHTVEKLPDAFGRTFGLIGENFGK